MAVTISLEVPEQDAQQLEAMAHAEGYETLSEYVRALRYAITSEDVDERNLRDSGKPCTGTMCRSITSGMTITHEPSVEVVATPHFARVIKRLRKKWAFSFNLGVRSTHISTRAKADFVASSQDH